MESKLIAMILGVALVLATATVYTQSVFAAAPGQSGTSTFTGVVGTSASNGNGNIHTGGNGGNGVNGGQTGSEGYVNGQGARS